MPLSPASSALALHMTGDLAGITYVQKGQQRRTSYAKTYPKRAPTGAQIVFRSKFKLAVAEWQALDTEHKQTLDKICLAYNMIMSGYNLYISCYMNRRLSWIDEWSEELKLPW